MSRILVIDDDVNLLQMVKLMLERVGHQVEIAKEGMQGIQLAAEHQPDLAIIDVMMPGLSGYDVVRKLRQDPRTARIPILILTARSQPMDKEMALEAGANAFMSKPVTAQELTERVEAVIRAGVNYRVHTGLLTEPIPSRLGRPGTGRLGTGPLAPPRQTPAPAAPTGAAKPAGAGEPARTSPKPPPRLPVTTVISLRGGTGCTTIAINLAAALTGESRRVCLADFSAVGGHVALYLHLKPEHSWQDLLSQGDTPSAANLPGLLTAHASSGLTVLAAPSRPLDETLSTPATHSVLRALTMTYAPVVVDARQLDPATRGALQVSSSVVVVMTDDPPAVQSTSQLLGVLAGMGLEMGRIRVVLNHVRPTFDVPADAIQKALKRPISVDVPYEPGQPIAVRRGIPLVSTKPESAFARSIQQLARTVVS
jgi:pilus assembly protein CpaE